MNCTNSKKGADNWNAYKRKLDSLYTYKLTRITAIIIDQRSHQPAQLFIMGSWDHSLWILQPSDSDCHS